MVVSLVLGRAVYFEYIALKELVMKKLILLLAVVFCVGCAHRKKCHCDDVMIPPPAVPYPMPVPPPR